MQNDKQADGKEPNERDALALTMLEKLFKGHDVAFRVGYYDSDLRAKEYAQAAYRLADAMIEERSRR